MNVTDRALPDRNLPALTEDEPWLIEDARGQLTELDPARVERRLHPSAKASHGVPASSTRSLNIAHITPLYEAVPPLLYGGTERIVAHLIEALTDLGHHVTLFASADARTKARLIPVRDRAIRLDPAPLKSDVAAHLAMLHEVRERANEFDILHFHLDLLYFPFFEDIAERTVTTLHGRLDIKDLAGAYQRWPEYPLVSISNHQRRALPFANWVATIYHGIPADQYRFAANANGGYLAFLGRIAPEKRPDRAINIAKRCGIPLKIAAKVDAVDAAYFRETIQPLLAHSDVEFIGEIGEAAKAQFLGDAKALIFPIDWPEPFGLVMIEAMACGTPVIGWDCGSVPEVVDDAASGFIVRSEDEAVAAIQRLDTIERKQVRAVFEQRFAAETMAANYVGVYMRQLGRERRAHTAWQTA